MKDRSFFDSSIMMVDLIVTNDQLSIYDDGAIDLDRNKARELAAILTHFADTGELPGEASDGN